MHVFRALLRYLGLADPCEPREPCWPEACVPMPGTVGPPRCIYCRHPIEED
jgi:hypothetical protein